MDGDGGHLPGKQLFPHLRTGLPLKPPAGEVDAPPASRDATVLAHDAMTRDDQGQWVRRSGLRDRSSGAGATDSPGDFRIGGRRARGNLQEDLPHALLERRATTIEREVQSPGRRTRTEDGRVGKAGVS